jgi:hypothetical protein
VAIISYFILNYFQLREIIVGYLWLLKAIGPYIIINYSKLYYHKLFMVIILVVIVGYSIGGYWYYFIGGYWWLLY